VVVWVILVWVTLMGIYLHPRERIGGLDAIEKLQSDLGTLLT